MADTAQTLAGWQAGDAMAVDNDGTWRWPYVKLAFGASGTQTHVDNTNPLPVTAAAGAAESVDDTDTHTAAVTAAVNVAFVAAPTDTAVDANDIGMAAMSLDRRQLVDADIAIDGASITGGAGAVAAGTPRVTLASDDPAVLALQLIDNAISGAGFNITQFGGAAVPIGAGTEAAAVRVTLPTDGTGVVKLGAGSAVIGALTANQSVNVAQMNGVTTTMGNGASSAGVQRVTIASDSTGNIATIGTSVTPGTAAVNLGKAIDAVVGATDTGVAALVRRRDTAATLTPANADYTTLNVNSLGHLWITGTHLEDAAHASGDHGIQMLAVSAASPTARAGTAGDYQPLSVSSVDGRLFVAAALDAETTKVIGAVNHSTTGIGHGVKTIATAGTDEVLAASTPAKWVTIQAQTDNTGLVAVGASGVDATVATGTGVGLAAGESTTVPCDNLNDIYIDTTVNGEGVRYTYGT